MTNTQWRISQDTETKKMEKTSLRIRMKLRKTETTTNQITLWWSRYRRWRHYCGKRHSRRKRRYWEDSWRQQEQQTSQGSSMWTMTEVTPNKMSTMTILDDKKTQWRCRRSRKQQYNSQYQDKGAMTTSLSIEKTKKMKETTQEWIWSRSRKNTWSKRQEGSLSKHRLERRGVC